MLLSVAGVSLFSLLYSFQWIGYATLCLSILLLVDIWVISSFWLRNSAAMNILINVSYWRYVCISSVRWRYNIAHILTFSRYCCYWWVAHCVPTCCRWRWDSWGAAGIRNSKGPHRRMRYCESFIAVELNPWFSKAPSPSVLLSKKSHFVFSRTRIKAPA